MTILLVALILAYLAYTANLQSNPPGFYLDESSIALNAYTISETGRDEQGIFFPVYFKAFGEYKNPVYIYLLAAVFKLFGPSILAARLFSCTLGYSAACLNGFLGFRLTGSRTIGIFVGTTALVFPWLFEVSRLVFEVALLPLILTLFLLALERVRAKEKWNWLDSFWIAASLGIFTYTYSICRLLGPLLTIGLAFFINRERWISIAKTWFLYSLMLIPLLWFAFMHPGALSQHFYNISYLSTKSKLTEIVAEFTSHYLHNINLWEWLVVGDQRTRHHVEGIGSILIIPLLVALSGLFIVMYRYRNQPWWRFILYGLIISVVPASLTLDDIHSLRLIAFPVFLLIFMAPTLEWMMTRGGKKLLWQIGVFSLLGLTLIQALIFQHHFHRQGLERRLPFDADYPAVLQPAIARPEELIYLPDTSYAHAYWYGTLAGIDHSRFRRHPETDELPEGVLVIRRNKRDHEDVGQVISNQGQFIAYLVGHK